jgi:hypothetical protein
MLAPMRVLVALLILGLFASPTCAEVVYTNAFLRAEAQSISLSSDKTRASVSVALTNTTAAPYPIVFLSAGLKDNRGNFFEPAGRPVGIVTGRPYTCEGGVVLVPGKRLDIEFSFRVSPAAMLDTPALNFLAEFQAQRRSCENFTVSVPNLSVVTK